MSMRKISPEKNPSVRMQKDMATLAKSFSFAIRGFRYAVDNERNMRIHLTVALFVLEFSFFYGVNRDHYAMLFMMFGLVLTAEMLNTAIEALVNLETQSFAPLARVAKDVAAGAVFVLAIAAVIVAILIFGDMPKLMAAATMIMDHPLLLIGFVLEIILAYFFIFRWEKRKMLLRKK